MLKTIVLFVFIVEIFSIERQVKLDYLRQLVVPNVPILDSKGDLIVKLFSLQKTGSLTPITIELRQIPELDKPLTSVKIDSKDCIFQQKNCSVSFELPQFKTSSKYTIRLIDETSFRSVEATMHWSTAKRVYILMRDFKVLTSPKAPQLPGFKFYMDAPKTWTAKFRPISYPAPIFESYYFTLWSVSGTSLMQYATSFLTVPGSVSFTISDSGYYYLSVQIKVSQTSAQTKYPIVLNFTFPDNLCAPGEYYERQSTSCSPCNKVQNAKSTTSIPGICDCETNYYWSSSRYKCLACPRRFFCPSPPKKNQLEMMFGKEDLTQGDYLENINQLIEEFNNFNLRTKQ